MAHRATAAHAQAMPDAAGKLADMVVLEKDLHKVAPRDISMTKVKLTMMNGGVTYRAK